MLKPYILFINLFMMIILMNYYKCFYFLSSMLFLFVFFMISNMMFFIEWIFIYNIFSLNYYSYGLILLVLWIMSLVFLSLKNEKMMLICLNLLFLMMLVMLMIFYSNNFLFFYLMFEISLMLMFILIIMWGLGSLRVMASYYLMFYTLIFSLPMLLILLNLFNNIGSESFIIMEMMKIIINKMIFIYLIMSFLVKLPMFLVHGWLLKAHVEAPVYCSMILASLMLKLGSYGLLRLMKFLYKNFSEINIYFLELGLMGSIILSLQCFRQIDMKVLVAMSSVVHMSFMMSSMMTLMNLGLLGSYMMMIAHGLCSSGMFFILNLSYKITNSRLMIMNKGVMSVMPLMSLMWFLICSSNMAAPMSLNLVSEIFMMISLVSYLKMIVLKLFFYCLLSFMYSIYFFSYINHGSGVINFKNHSGKMIDYLILLLHWVPLNMLIFNLFLF